MVLPVSPRCCQALTLCFLAGVGHSAALLAQEQLPPSSTITVQSRLVLVPTEVTTKHGEIIFGLQRSDFSVDVDGVSQQVRLDSTGAPTPLSLVVLVQCSRDAWREGPKERGLADMVEAVVGSSTAQVAVVDFGKELELLTGLTSDVERWTAALQHLEPCPEDPGAGIFDTLAYANRLLDRDHASGRRFVLLISETRDHGSQANAASVLTSLSQSNTTVNAIAFSPARDAMGDDLKYADGAAGGVFGILGTALQALRKNAPKELAQESGGEYINFGSARQFDRSLNVLANRMHNTYDLSFVPRLPVDLARKSLHQITVRLDKYPDAILRHRTDYWSLPDDSAGHP